MVSPEDSVLLISTMLIGYKRIGPSNSSLEEVLPQSLVFNRSYYLFSEIIFKTNFSHDNLFRHF